MSLRTRLFVLFSALLAGLLALAWWGSRLLTANLNAELDQVAVTVGQSVVAMFGEEERLGGWVGHDESGGTEVVVERIVQTDERTVRAKHRQVGDRITHLSIQVDGQAEQVLALPQRATPAINNFVIDLAPEELLGSVVGRRLRLAGGDVRREIEVPGSGVAAAIQSHSSRLLAGLAGLFALGVLMAGVLAHRVSAPLRRLQAAAQRVGEGELGAQVRGEGVQEVQETIAAFNRMSRHLGQLQRQQDNVRARQHLSEIGEIGRGLAHSLRNPLNAIGLTVDELATRSGHQKDLRLAQDARCQIQRIDQSIRAFLTLASQDQAETTTVDLYALAQDVALELAHQAQQVRVVIEGEAVAIEGIEAELRAMLHALMVNAVEASPDQGQVSVLIEADGEGARIEIVDQGPGIAEAIRPRLFEPHATTKADGSGMGLFVTQRMAHNRYRGRLRVATRAVGGTCAELVLGPRQGLPT